MRVNRKRLASVVFEDAAYALTLTPRQDYASDFVSYQFSSPTTESGFDFAEQNAALNNLGAVVGELNW